MTPISTAESAWDAEHPSTELRVEPVAPAARKAGSYLVRIWMEPREEGGPAASPIRLWARDLGDGSERYFEGAEGIGGWLRERVLASASGAARRRGATNQDCRENVEDSL